MLAELPTTLAEQLAIAERHVREGELRINVQRDRIRHLELNGRGAAEERRLLAELEKTQLLFVTDRDRLRDEFAGVWSDTPASTSPRET